MALIGKAVIAATSRKFEPFAQSDDSLRRRHGGAGVGLPAAKRHARRLGGDVVLGSTSSAGSVFILTARLEPLEPTVADVPADGLHLFQRLEAVGRLNRSTPRRFNHTLTWPSR